MIAERSSSGEPTGGPSRRTATLIGLSAILWWSVFAALIVFTGPIPPFQLAAMTFAIGAAMGPVAGLLLRQPFAPLRISPRAWIVGVAGLFGYHALYFAALKLAPPAEVSLVNYLWPLLIVLFASLLPGERLAWHHLAGALMGLAGTAALLAPRLAAGMSGNMLPGFAAAFGAAVVWAVYSVTSRALRETPTAAVAVFCLATSVLAAGVHLAVEATLWPPSLGQWLAIIAIGIGPVGLAFYAWDIGVKRGEIRVLGVASYATPLLSTLLLIVIGAAHQTPTLLLAALLIAGGGLVAARDMLRPQP